MSRSSPMTSKSMNYRSFIRLLLVLSLAGGAMAADAATPVPDFHPMRVMVQLVDGRWEPRTVSADSPSDIQALEAQDDVISIAPIRTYQELEFSNPPSDPFYPDQWHLQRNQAARSWQFGDGSGVTVAVIDSGIGSPSDLDCLDIVAPYDVRTYTATVPPDATGHGTFVSSVIAECTDNSSAAAGVAPGVSLMPIGVIGSTGTSTTDQLYLALIWARDHGAEVVNLSLGFSCVTSYTFCNDPAVDSAIESLVASGTIVVAASGNDGGSYVSYPANHPSVLSVGASGYDGLVAAYSTRGAGLDLVAPTGDSNDPATKNGVLQQGLFGLAIGAGTSFSAPQASAAMAILLSAGAASPDLAIDAALTSAHDIAPSGYDTTTGYGELRIRDALAWGGLGLTPPIADASFLSTGDFDGDGSEDALSYDGVFGRWWALISAGTRFEASQWAKFSSISGWSARLIGDFSGDGRDDVANFHPSNGTWWVSRSTGTSFTTSLWADFSTASGWGPQVVGDFNGDGKDDIAQFHSSNGTWWVSRSTGTSFTTSLWADFSTASGWGPQISGDFDGDGKDDIANYNAGNGTWWISRSTGTSFSTTRWADFTTASGWQSRVVGDFNGDGKDDIAQFHPSNGTWWISRSTGTSLATSLWADFSTASGWGPQISGDFDGDGKDDIANYNTGNGTWWVSRSTGSALTTSLWADFSTAKGWGLHVSGDFDSDGVDDIASYYDSTGVWVVSGSTGSSFVTKTWFD